MSEKTWCDEKISEFSDLVESLGAENIAAFIAEPILASGGVIVPATWLSCQVLGNLP